MNNRTRGVPDHPIHSYDVFDTCLTRRHARPADLFVQLGLRVAEAHALPEPREAFARRFAAARIRAERMASLRARPHECPVLAEIYAHMVLDTRLAAHRDEVRALEVQLERECIYLVPEILERLRASRAAGARVVFISDMYLPSTVLGPIMEDLGLMEPSDRLYVSSDIRLTKHSGNLFRHVLREERIQPCEMLHVGDNVWADVEVPRRLGIAAAHFSRAMLGPREVRISGAKRLSASHHHSFIAALSRESRLHVPPVDSHPADELIHSTIAPLLVSYVAWVIDHARRSGVRRLYFVARDGEVMFKIARQLLRGEHQLEARYLYGSRRAWHPASITPGSTVWTRALTPQGQKHTAAIILDRIGLPTPTRQAILEQLGIGAEQQHRRMDMDECAAFVGRLADHGVVADLIGRASSRARELVLGYFEQEGLLDDKPWALVDTGWSLNCQASLRRILSSRLGRDFRPTGYYLALMPSRLGEEEAGIAHGFVSRPEEAFCRRRTMVEHCFTPATHASTIGYQRSDGVIAPVFGSETRSTEALAYVQRLHEICTGQARIIARDESLLARLLAASPTLIENAERLMLRPEQQEAESLQALSASADFFDEAGFSQAFCRPLGMQDLRRLLRMMFSRRARHVEAPYVWLEGSCALSPGYIRLPVFALLRCKRLMLRAQQKHRAPSAAFARGMSGHDGAGPPKL